MSRKLNETFRHLIQLGNGKKTVVYECPDCGCNFTAMRRDLTYVIVTFLISLHDMWKADGQDYHAYRDVIAFAVKNHQCTPSDYSILERWKLIDTKPGINQGKYKKISANGYKFLCNELPVAAFHYQLPHCEEIMYSKEKITFKELRDAYLEKLERKPFHKK